MKTITVEHENKETIHKLDKCTNAAHPEMARNNESDDPCETE